MLPTLLLLLAAQAASPPTPADISRYTGIAREPGTHGAVLYREDHYRYGPSDDRRELVLYRCPDGAPFARKTLHGPAVTPLFELVDAANGYREGVRDNGDARQVFVRPVGADATRERGLDTPRDAVIDAGFDAYVRRHWDALAAGKTRRIAFLVPSRLDYMAFRIKRHRDAAAARRGVLVLRLELDSWIAFALPHIDVGYDMRTRQLHWFRGLSNLRDRDGRNVRVRLVYPADQRLSAVPAAELAAARKAPLDGRCPLH